MSYFQRYEHITIIARGGQGEVWKVLDTWNQEFVAIKYLLDKSSQGRDLFIKDVRERKEDRHTILVKDSNLYCENPYFVMEYCPSGNLATKILKCSTLELIVVLRAMIIALRPLHRTGGFHGDIKPDNIMLADVPNGTTPKLTDFGLAHVPNLGSNMTWTPRGTDPYKSPEVRQKLSYSSKADVYSLGVTIFELLTGQPASPIRFFTPGPTKLIDLLCDMTADLPLSRPNLDQISVRLDEIERELNTDGLQGTWASLSYPGLAVCGVGAALILKGLFGGKK
jgi:serine/threonine protein kinase